MKPVDPASRTMASRGPDHICCHARETVSDVVARGGFPPVYLAPVNFDAIYMQRLQQAQAEAAPKIEIAH